ncbi:MAG TPA: biotin transporter BioY [Longimicrobiales bacterium]|jgi:biotin transport system substrate-specific component
MTSPLPALPLFKRILAVVAGALAVAASAQLSVPVPGSPVPQSLQTLAVVVVGGVLGWGRGVAALLLYLCLGAGGLPVFADGASGVERLLGSTGGYLAGFVVGVGVAGWWTTRTASAGWGWQRTAPVLAAGFALCHVLILGMGWARLAIVLGAADAWSEGVAPFLWGGAVKSVVAAGCVAGWRRWVGVPGPLAAGAGGWPVEPGPPTV